MSNSPRKAVIAALLDEYDNVINDLKNNISGINDSDLTKILDAETKNKDCISIQSVLTHIIYCGHNYITMIDIDRGNAKSTRAVRKKFNTIPEYLSALDSMLHHCKQFFENVDDSEMAQYDPAKKITAGWGQLFDYEQLMEHAIVHVSRHRRQIQKFKSILH